MVIQSITYFCVTHLNDLKECHCTLNRVPQKFFPKRHFVFRKTPSGSVPGEHVPVLLVVSPVHDVDHPLGVGVAKVGVVRRPVVHHGLVYRVGRLVGEDAGGEAGDELLHSGVVAALQDVVVHPDVVAEEVAVGSEVGEQAAHLGDKQQQLTRFAWRLYRADQKMNQS